MRNKVGNRPNNTLYINNLNDKVKKEELRKSLYGLFGQFGQVLEVVAMKTMKMRGQAFIVFKDINSATQAHGSLKDFPFYGKPVKIQYAKNDSDIILKMKGTYKEHKAKQEALKRKMKPSFGKDNGKRKGLVEGGQNTSNHILFVENLPSDTQENQLKLLFEKFNGFKEVRLVNGRGDIAFVEFDSVKEASDAKESLDNFKISENNVMKVSFAKR